MKVLGYGNVKGVDVEKFNPQRFPSIQRNGTFVFLFVGRIVRDKGINELIEAFTKLNEKYRHVLLNIVGEFEDSLDPISELTKDIIASSSAINVLGPLYNEDLLEAYASADCFVLPSYREGFPNTVLEAGAMGLPSIVTDVNGSREIILDGENGYIVPPKNAVSLYSAMEKVFLDINHQKYMSQKARNLIIEKFDKNYVQECQIRFYEELLS
jgi:glycosyltransferase involved in cell wall biosynthesis